MCNAVYEILLNIIEDRTTTSQRGDADVAYEMLTSYEFVFIMHLMSLNAMHLASSTKSLLQTLSTDGWDGLTTNVI